MSFNFPKQVRLLRRHHFQRLSNPPQRYVGKWIIVDCKKNQLLYSRLGITVSRQFGKSHDRNRFKRLVREAFRLSLQLRSAGYDINIKPRSEAKKAAFQDIQDEFQGFVIE